jgi:hypothetical protein
MVVVVVRRGRRLSSAPRVQIGDGFSSPVPTLFRFPASFVFLFMMLFCFRVWKAVVVVLRRRRRWCWCYWFNRRGSVFTRFLFVRCCFTFWFKRAMV